MTCGEAVHNAGNSFGSLARLARTIETAVKCCGS